MKRLLQLLLLGIIVYVSWPFLQQQLDEPNLQSVTENVQEQWKEIKDSPELSAFFIQVQRRLNSLLGDLERSQEKLLEPEEEQQPQEQSTGPDIEELVKPELQTPTTQTFSVHNIELGTTKEQVESQLGATKRSSLNEYGVKWHAYHDNYQNFIMVAYDNENKVVGLYTNQDFIKSTKEISLGTTKQEVLEKMGEPLTEIRKGMTFYQLPEERDYDIFLIDNSYVTIFYDKHKDNTVTAIQIISKNLEENKDNFYAEASPELEKSFGYQLFDLTNATRVKHGLNVLTWDEDVKETAREHSVDMASSNFFDHTNLEGQSPFDRMLEDDIVFTLAGENLAYGQFSSIFAHHGLMNSLGHRENILKSGYEFLGVGVAFNQKSQPYFTENFFAN